MLGSLPSPPAALAVPTRRIPTAADPARCCGGAKLPPGEAEDDRLLGVDGVDMRSGLAELLRVVSPIFTR
jgi:hypothetical protein